MQVNFLRNFWLVIQRCYWPFQVGPPQRVLQPGVTWANRRKKVRFRSRADSPDTGRAALSRSAGRGRSSSWEGQSSPVGGKCVPHASDGSVGAAALHTTLCRHLESRHQNSTWGIRENGHRSLVGYSSCGCIELDMTEWLALSLSWLPKGVGRGIIGNMCLTDTHCYI